MGFTTVPALWPLALSSETVTAEPGCPYRPRRRSSSGARRSKAASMSASRSARVFSRPSRLLRVDECGAPNLAASEPTDTLVPELGLTYVGAVRVPRLADLSYGGEAIGVNPDTNTLYLSTKTHVSAQKIVEISIPPPVHSNSQSDWPIATLLRGPTDVSVTLRPQVTGSTTGYLRHTGLCVYSGKLYWTLRENYDADHSTALSHGRCDLDLTNPEGLWRLDAPQAGYVAGYIAKVPAGQVATFGPLISGRAGGPIINRNSTGPVAFGFDPTDFTSGRLVRTVTGATQADPVVITTSAAHGYQAGDEVMFFGVGGMTQINGSLSGGPKFTVANPTATTFELSGVNGTAYGAYTSGGSVVRPVPTTNLVYYTVSTTEIFDGGVGKQYKSTGAAAVESALILVGTTHVGNNWYGHSTSPEGFVDPCAPNYGSHSEGQKPHAWFYDWADLAQVAAGTVNPSDVAPYAERDLNDIADLQTPCAGIDSATFDETRGLLYCCRTRAESVGDKRYPVIHVYEVSG